MEKPQSVIQRNGRPQEESWQREIFMAGSKLNFPSEKLNFPASFLPLQPRNMKCSCWIANPEEQLEGGLWKKQGITRNFIIIYYFIYLLVGNLFCIQPWRMKGKSLNVEKNSDIFNKVNLGLRDSHWTELSWKLCACTCAYRGACAFIIDAYGGECCLNAVC